VLAAIWAEVLHVEGVGRHDSFLDLGGDSLLATMALSRLADAFGVKISIARFMECDTIARQGEIVDQEARLQAGLRQERSLPEGGA
jgi:acyl carrier protein